MTENFNPGEPFVGEVRMFAGNSEPDGWAFCDGRLLSLRDYPALFGVIGTTYGGDGVNKFAVPDLRGRVPLGHGAGPGLSIRTLGQQQGAENVALNVSNLPAHHHEVQGTNITGSLASPGGNVFAASSGHDYAAAGAALVNMAASTGTTGSGAPVPNIQPSLVLNFMIALTGRDPRGIDGKIIASAQVLAS